MMMMITTCILVPGTTCLRRILERAALSPSNRCGNHDHYEEDYDDHYEYEEDNDDHYNNGRMVGMRVKITMIEQVMIGMKVMI